MTSGTTVGNLHHKFAPIQTQREEIIARRHVELAQQTPQFQNQHLNQQHPVLPSDQLNQLKLLALVAMVLMRMVTVNAKKAIKKNNYAM